MTGLLLALALLQFGPPGRPPLPPGTTDGGRPIGVHLLFDTRSVALLWLEGTADGPKLRSVEGLPGEFRAWRYPVPVGDGTWVELLDGRMQPIGAYRSAVPAPGERCALEVPVVGGTWWVVLLRKSGGKVRVLAQYQVGPDLARIASRFGHE